MREKLRGQRSLVDTHTHPQPMPREAPGQEEELKGGRTAELTPEQFSCGFALLR